MVDVILILMAVLIVNDMMNWLNLNDSLINQNLGCHFKINIYRPDKTKNLMLYHIKYNAY